jgi:hypothetical protein
VTRSDSIAKIAPALVAAQAAFPSIVKDGKNPAFRSKYATLDGIMAAVRPALAANGLAVVQGAIHPETDGPKLVGLAVESVLVHTSGEWMATMVPVPVTKSDAHGLGSALSYGRRYGISALLALTTDEDDDGNAATRPPQQPRHESRQERPAAPPPPPAGQRLHERVPETPAAPMSLAKAEAMTMKGQRLGDMDEERLEKLAAWASEKGNAAIHAACQTILAAREAAMMADDMADEMDQVLNLPGSLPF